MSDSYRVAYSRYGSTRSISKMITSHRVGYLVFMGALACTSLVAQPGRSFRIEGLQCKGMNCELREGSQEGLTTIEADGIYRGVDAVRLQVVQRESKDILLDRKIGIMSNGKLTISIPAFRLPAGDYLIQVSRTNSQERLAVGSFRKSSSGAAPA